ncbi:hypothetical protein KIPB_008673 [Kipferlia bialata]|uniref:Uncharacterized protein n=1 Tax=Kipferlia bialata TaxID=797122 RepID=A0A9K3D105_9EUKA|nr:hypothetical protein KIPB_008673 [Kipferlia bialata]|eukprot:g8673.t1
MSGQARGREGIPNAGENRDTQAYIRAMAEMESDEEEDAEGFCATVADAQADASLLRDGIARAIARPELVSVKDDDLRLVVRQIGQDAKCVYDPSVTINAIGKDHIVAEADRVNAMHHETAEEFIQRCADMDVTPEGPLDITEAVEYAAAAKVVAGPAEIAVSGTVKKGNRRTVVELSKKGIPMNVLGGYNRWGEREEEESEEESEEDYEVVDTSVSRKGTRGGKETPEEKRARKAAVKAQKRERRKEKKGHKQDFKHAKGKAVKQNVAQMANVQGHQLA